MAVVMVVVVAVVVILAAVVVAAAVIVVAVVNSNYDEQNNRRKKEKRKKILYTHNNNYDNHNNNNIVNKSWAIWSMLMRSLNYLQWYTITKLTITPIQAVSAYSHWLQFDRAPDTATNRQQQSWRTHNQHRRVSINSLKRFAFFPDQSTVTK